MTTDEDVQPAEPLAELLAKANLNPSSPVATDLIPAEHRLAPTAPAPVDLPPVQTDSFVWYGPDQLRRIDEWCLTLSAEEVSELEAAAHGWLEAHPNVDTDRIAVCMSADFPLPTLAERLATTRRDIQHGRGFALVRGLPVERLSEREAAAIFSGIGAHLCDAPNGAMRSQDAFGRLVGHVRDVGLRSTDPTVRIYQTSERQSFHTDWADVVGLLCIKPAVRGGTSLLVSSSTIFNEMRAQRPDLLALLMQPIAMDCRGEYGMDFTLDPVFNFYDGVLTTMYHRQYFNSAQRFPHAPRLTPLHVEALNFFDELANSPELHFSLNLQPGDMSFCYNHTLLHDRTAFEDSPDPADRRHLLRIWLALPGDRALPPSFAPRFDGVEVGRRGGVTVTKPYGEQAAA